MSQNINKTARPISIAIRLSEPELAKLVALADTSMRSPSDVLRCLLALADPTAEIGIRLKDEAEK